MEKGTQDVQRKESSKQRKNDVDTKIQNVRGETDINVKVKDQQKKRSQRFSILINLNC